MKVSIKFAMLMLLLMLAACGGGDEPEVAATEPAVAEPTEAPEQAEPTAKPTEAPTEEPTALPEPTAEPTAEPTPEPTEEPTAEPVSMLGDGPNTYTDPESGFTFSYPADWFIETLYEGRVIVANVELDDSDSMPDDAIAIDFYVDGGSYEAQVADVVGEIDSASADEAKVLSPYAEFTVGDNKAGRTTLESYEDITLFTDIVLIDMGDMTPTFQAFGAPENAATVSAMLDAILDSAEIGEPLVAAPDNEQADADTDDDSGQSTKDVVPSGDMQTYVDEALALSFEYPADWFAENIFDLFLVVSNTEFDMASEENQSVGVFVSITPTEEDGTVEEQLAEAMSELESGEAEGVTLLEEPEDLEVDGKPAKRITASIEEDGETQVTSIVLVDNGNSVASFVSFAPQDSWEQYIDVFDAIIASAELGEPNFDEAFADFGDEDVDDGDTATAPAMVPTDVPEGDVGVGFSMQAEDETFVSFNLTGGVDYYILAQPLGTGDVTLAVVDADGNRLAEIDDNASERAELLPFTPDADGAYSVQIAEYGGAAHAFNLQVLEVAAWDSAEISADNEIEHTVELAPSTTAQLFIVVPPEDMDVGISGDSGSFDIDFYADSGFEGETELLVIPPSDSDGRSVTIWSLDVDGTVEYALVELGDVFLPAASGFIELDNADTQTVFGQSTLPNQLVFDVSDESAVRLRFSGQAGQSLAARIDPDEALDATIEVSSAGGVLFLEVDSELSGDSELVSLRIDTPEVSEYVLSLGGWLGSAGDFTASVFHDGGMTVEVPGQGAVIAPLAADAPLRYQCMADGAIPLVVSLTSNIGEVDAGIEIFDEAGELVLEMNDGGLGDDETALLLEPTEQLYTVVVTALEGSATNTTLSITCSG